MSSMTTEALARAADPLEHPLPAPKVGDILANDMDLLSRHADPFYAYRIPAYDGLTPPQTPESTELPGTIVAVSEAEALLDFDSKMMTVAGILRTLGNTPEDALMADLADRLRKNVCFIGRREFDAGTEAIAAHWLKVLAQPETDTITVLIEPEASSSYVYGAVRKVLGKLGPGALKRVHALENNTLTCLSEEERERIRKCGIRLLDDWSLSGAQMSGMIGDVAYLVGGVDPAKMEIDLICGRDKHLDNGLDQIKCNAYYQYYYNEDAEDGDISVTGAHCNTDYGFAETIDGCYETMKELVYTRRGDPAVDQNQIHLPYPLLYDVARYYAPTEVVQDSLRLGSPEAFEAYDKAVASYRQLAAKHSRSRFYDWLG